MNDEGIGQQNSEGEDITYMYGGERAYTETTI